MPELSAVVSTISTELWLAIMVNRYVCLLVPERVLRRVGGVALITAQCLWTSRSEVESTCGTAPPSKSPAAGWSGPRPAYIMRRGSGLPWQIVRLHSVFRPPPMPTARVDKLAPTPSDTGQCASCSDLSLGCELRGADGRHGSPTAISCCNAGSG
ncbi:uncharacterized protein M421DRAFT_347553 [Didymella exigua CBS 183.55]|uniref:Uncharacterized protein n=1 Tax=Didymella exigua CBS 183.55 TaxID=1150837 RepID=A0A6A5RV45_9PLEO|nr:uncharacterized protein M421DRAFT_347553 [Didymella exigua CBS 183.55]KAF1931449.1 hypothetical protein M421DRAFT_347553 [Didymella exigua CBS 183.55]